MLDTLRSKKWYRGRGQMVNRFEQAYAQLTGAKFCLATANGTSALFTSLNGLGVEPGDEVLVPPYTFIATVNVVLREHALPVFVDTDAETFQMDARKIEASFRRAPARSSRCIWAAARATSMRFFRSPPATRFPSWKMPARRTWESGAAAR